MGTLGEAGEDTRSQSPLHIHTVSRMHHGLLSLLFVSGSLMIAMGASDYYDDYSGDILKDEDLVKRAWNSQFNGGMGKRAWNSQFNGGMGKRAWNSQFNGGMGKRAWTSNFSGGMGKRAWNSNFSGGLGKRNWNSGFTGGMGKREVWDPSMSGQSSE